MSDSENGITDSVEVEHTAADALDELVEGSAEPVVEPEAEVVPVVASTEHGWTAQSSNGVLLPHFVPTQDYSAIEADPAERIDVADDAEF